MKTERYVDRSLDDFIKANRGMFRRGRGGRGGRETTSKRGGRGGAGPSRGAARGRSRSLGGRGRGGARGGARSPARSPRGRAAPRGTRGVRGASRGGRGRGGQRGAARASFSQTWRASSAKMGGRLSEAAPRTKPAARMTGVRVTQRLSTKKKRNAETPRKDLKVKAFVWFPPQRSGFLTSLQMCRPDLDIPKILHPSEGRPRNSFPTGGGLTTLALQKKRKAMQQLISAKRQLSRTDAREELLMKRRGLTTNPEPAGSRRKSAGAAGRRAAPPGRLQERREPAPAPLRRPLNRSRLTSRVSAPSAGNLLTIQIKNDQARARRPPSPPPFKMEYDEDMPYPPSPPPAAPSPPPPVRAGLNPRIQQEIAVIQARGRAQHHLSEERRGSGVSNFRPMSATSKRTLNDRFTADRVIFS